MKFHQERICASCGKKSFIYEIHYPAPDGWDHDCSCPYCDERFFVVRKKWLDDYVAFKEKKR